MDEAPELYKLSSMTILGIETSCDETSASVVKDGTQVLCCIIASSRKDFEGKGGVIPEEAARRQVECILPVITRALETAHITVDDIDSIAVTKGPGLLGSLLVGTATARVLASIWKKPLIGVDHLLGHLDSIWLQSEGSDKSDPPMFPCLTLSVSGGHSDLRLRRSHTNNTLIGTTRDDAAGEAFDKGASLLGLSYPGGPALSKLAEGGNEHAFKFPSPLHQEETFDFSFSGLKTSLKYTLRDHPNLFEQEKKDLAASYQYAICKHLTDRIEHVVEKHSDIQEMHLVGGVSANTRLRSLLQESIYKKITIRWPATLRYCTDNAAMIAAAGYFLMQESPEKALESFVTEAALRC
jgi:N6-L-threonylcarbamoyladenine synthase